MLRPRQRHLMRPVQCDQRRFSAAMVLLACEPGVCGGEELECELTGALFIFAVQAMRLLPCGRFDNHHRDFEQLNCRFESTAPPAKFKTRTRALPRHRLSAFDHRLIRLMLLDPRAQRQNVDALLRLDADGGKVNRVDKLRGGPVIDQHDGAATADGSGIDTEDLHATLPQSAVQNDRDAGWLCQRVTSAPAIPHRCRRNTASSPKAARIGGAPEFAGCSDPSGRQNLMRSARNKIAAACRQMGSNHAASVRACNRQMPLLCAASLAIHLPTA